MATRRRKPTAGHPENATLPPAPFHQVQDRGQSENCVKFFRYWKEVAGTTSAPTESAGLVSVKFYMQWPVCDPKLADPHAKTRVHTEFHGPMWFENPEDYLQETLKALGSGEWMVVLNEENVHGELMRGYFGAVDLDQYPPKVDLKTIVRGVSKNQDYITWLKRNNVKLPWDDPEEEERMASQEMATAVNVVADALRDTTNKVLESKDREVAATREALEAQVAKANAESSHAQAFQGQAIGESIALVTSTAKEMIHTMAEGSRSSFDPIAIMQTAATLMRPQGPDEGMRMVSEAIRDSNARMVEMQKAQFELIQNLARPQAGSSVLGGLDGILDSADKLKRAADLFGWSRGREVVQAEQKSGVMEWMKENPGIVLTAVTTGLTMLANILHNMKAAPGQARNPQEDLRAAQQQQPHPNPIITMQPRPAPPPPTTQGTPLDAGKTVVSQMAPQMKKYYFDDPDLGGYMLAEWVTCEGAPPTATERGQKDYRWIRDTLGRANFDQIVRANDDLWPMFQGNLMQYEKFLNQFFDYEVWAMQKGDAA